jgi:hypothetical protein
VLLGAIGKDRLVGGGRERPQEIDEMRAALGAAEELAHLLVESGIDPQAAKALEVGRDGGADGIRARLGHRLDGVDHQPVVDGEPHPHVMHRLARRERAAEVIAEGIGLGVGEMTFDVPEPILAAETAALDGAGVDGLARDGG